jgi:hypothetical protein
MLLPKHLGSLKEAPSVSQKSITKRMQQMLFIKEFGLLARGSL